MQGVRDMDLTSREADLVSCLCVTEGRAAFLPWLIWNYLKQDYRHRELVIVDSSRDPLPQPDDPQVRVLRCPAGTSVARKRNLAVEAAEGAFVSWFDDDDWQHPRKLSILTAALGEDGLLAGPTHGWFVDLQRGRTRPFDAQRSVIFNGLAVRRSALAGVRFDERKARAADTAWVTAIRRTTCCRVEVVREILSCWLCHDANLSNPVTRYVFPHRLADVSRAVGEADWGATDEELARLRDRIVSGPPARR
jgi:glycosyltransferase involved in cell wall biosynthesis